MMMVLASAQIDNILSKKEDGDHDNDADKLRNHESVKKGWVTIENNPDTSGFIISSDKCVINGFKAEKNDGDERSILLHIGILSPFNDDPVIIIKQKEI